jgi:hypothetical protein
VTGITSPIFFGPQVRTRKDLWVEAFVYKRALDQQTYQEQLDKLNEEITLAELDL